MSYLHYLCLFGSSLPPVVSRRRLMSYLRLLVIYIICVCLVRLYLQLLVGGLMSYLHYLCLLVRLYLQLLVGGLMTYLHYLCLFSSSLPPVVSRRAHVLFTLFVFVWFVFTSSC